MTRLFPDPRSRPVAAGMTWAVLTFALLLLIDWLRGDLPSATHTVALAVLLPIGGLAWGYFMRWNLNRHAPAQPEGR